MALRCIQQLALAATSETDLISGLQYESYVVVALTVCNRDTTAASFRLRLKLIGEAADNKQFLLYDMPVLGNDTYVVPFQFGVRPGEVLTGYASSANLSVQIQVE